MATFLVGEWPGLQVRTGMRNLGSGRLVVKARPDSWYPGEPVAIDNGAFACWMHGQEWDGDAYLRRIAKWHAAGVQPFFAVLPDRVANPGSLEFSLQWLERLPAEWPWYLAVQNGMEPEGVAQVLRDRRIAGLFLGGDDAFKETAPVWSELAHARGLCFHYARAGTARKVRLAFEAGADSLDSSLVARVPYKLPIAARAWRRCLLEREYERGSGGAGLGRAGLLGAAGPDGAGAWCGCGACLLCRLREPPPAAGA